ncbi:hypothetical protein OT109_06940 [Phycisphaeraceae bacterium D3-23]
MPHRLAAALLALCIALPALAQDAPTSPDAQRIAALEEENQRLRQELAELRMELANLRRAMRDTEANGEGEDEDEAMEGDTADGATDADAEAGGVGEADADADEPRTFDSADEIFRTIPESLRPGRNGWGIVQRVEVMAWLTDNIPGNHFSARLEVRDVDIRYSTTAETWQVTVAFENQDMRFMSWGMEQKVGSVTLTGDGDFAERARRLQPGARVQVTGEIAAIGWDVAVVQEHDEDWKPTHSTIRLQEAGVRSPHLRQ